MCSSDLEGHIQIDYDRDMTFVALGPQALGAAMAGEVRAVCDPDNRQAEFAMQVAGGWQRKGLGAILLRRLLRYLGERGTQEVVGQCLAENAGMAALARKSGFEVKPQAGGVVAMRMALQKGRG